MFWLCALCMSCIIMMSYLNNNDMINNIKNRLVLTDSPQYVVDLLICNLKIHDKKSMHAYHINDFHCDQVVLY